MVVNDNKIYMNVLQNGLDQGEEINKAVDEICNRNIENVFLVGCGGSLAVMYACNYILDTRSNIPSYAFNASEFNVINHKQFSENSLVILSSYTGSTKETVEAAKIARKAGAPTIGFMGKLGTPLAENVDFAFANDAATGVTDSKLIMLYQVIFRLMQNKGQCEDYDEIIKALKTLPTNLVKVKEKYEKTAEEFAIKYKDEDYFMTIGAGILWGETYSYATCIIEEMQWIKARSVHAGEFFHGSFEIVTRDTNVLLFRGEDETRPLCDRVERFCNKYTDKLTIIDTKDFPLEGVNEEYRGLFSPLVLSAALDRVSKHLEDKRNHSLKIRRYMGIVEY